MKQLMVLVLSVVVVTTARAQATHSLPLSLGVKLGGASPAGRYADVMRQGYGAGALIERGIGTSRFSVRVDVEYERFPRSDQSADPPAGNPPSGARVSGEGTMSSIDALLSIRAIGSPAGAYGYVLAGAGFTRVVERLWPSATPGNVLFSATDRVFSATVGGGVSYPLRYACVFTEVSYRNAPPGHALLSTLGVRW